MRSAEPWCSDKPDIFPVITSEIGSGPNTWQAYINEPI